MASFEFQMTLVGPSRVGKTSLVTSILSQAEELLAGTPVSLEPRDSATETRISENRSDLKACFFSNDFDVATLASTQSLVEFKLKMGVGKSNIHFDILDVPGEWLRPELKKESGWKKYMKWLKESSVLIVPVDATLLMEGMSTPAEERKSLKNLRIEGVTRVARRWAKSRLQYDESSLLILAPVKCESYFPENGGPKGREDELYRKTKNELLYGDVIRAVQDEVCNYSKDQNLANPIYAPRGDSVKIEYHPVGTLGCVSFIDGEFDSRGGFTARYGKRMGPNMRYKPYGADGVLISIVKHALLGAANNPDGVWKWFVKWLTGESGALREAITTLSKKDYHSRVHTIAIKSKGA